MNPLAELTQLTLLYFPLFALFVLAGAFLVRFALGKEASVPAVQQNPVGEVALAFGWLGIVLLHGVSMAYAAAPRLFPPVLLGLWESLFLAAWAGLTFGALVHACARAKAWRAGNAAQARPATYYALLALTGLSGMGMSVCCRWSATWLWPAWKSWLLAWVDFSGALDAAASGLLFAMPLAVPVCLLLLVCCGVVGPASGLSLGEIFPFRSVLKRLRQGAATTSSGA